MQDSNIATLNRRDRQVLRVVGYRHQNSVSRGLLRSLHSQQNSSRSRHCFLFAILHDLDRVTVGQKESPHGVCHFFKIVVLPNSSEVRGWQLMAVVLELPSTKTRPTLGDRAFQSAAPYLWNALPSTIRNIKTLDTFKTAVKTHFCKLAFKQIFSHVLSFNQVNDQACNFQQFLMLLFAFNIILL